MTLDEAILHAEEVAADCEAYENQDATETRSYPSRRKCAAEHRQLAAWLRELQERRKAPEIIRCGECRHKGTKNCVANTWATIFGFDVKDDFYCGLAERRNDE